MTVFKIKTGSIDSYRKFQDKSNNTILIDHLIQYEDYLELDAPVLLLFGGDGTPWKNGLAGLCKIASKPIDYGYETASNGNKYYKLEIEIVVRLKQHLAKIDFARYPETFDTGIGPSTKGERNQAPGIIEDEKALCAICRAIIDKEPDKLEVLKSFFGDKILNKALNETIVYISPSKDNYSFNCLSNLILYGPPGTGKTYIMQHDYIDKFAKEDRFITTFHQSFSYEEFVEGLKPVLADKPDGDTSSDVKYKIEKGIFYKACERAAELAGYESKKDESETPLQKCIADVDRSTKMDEAIKENKIVLLCIDEINRANVSAVFGDLISLIEPSKRIGAKNEMMVSLPYSKEDFAVPSNLMIVGTMNTADRSIQLLDSALRRRFRFEELLPDYEKIDNATAKEILQKINARIRCLLDKDHQIGHSYFIEAKNDLDIFNALKDSVIPLLEEYFYNDAQKIRQILNENDNTDTAFYVKDEEAENASRLIQNDYDDDKAFYQLNPKLSEVKDEDSAASFISHIAPKAD